MTINEDAAQRGRASLDQVERAATEVLVNQLDIARQSIEGRDRRIWELQKESNYWREMLNRLAAQRTGVPTPQPQPQPAAKAVPRRWAIR